MKTFVKILVSIVIIGLILCLVGLIIIDFDFSRISASFNKDKEYTSYEENTDYAATSIIVNADNRIVNFVKSEDEKINITYYQSDDDIVTYKEKDNKIIIENEHKRKFWWFNWGHISQKVKTITVALPQTFNGNINVDTSNGTISAKNLTQLTSLSLETSNGMITIENIEVEDDIYLKSSNGKLRIRNIICTSHLELKTSNGAINITDTTADKITAKTSNGRINIDDTISDNITADTSNGNVDITVIGNYDDYEIKVDTTNGAIEVEGIKLDNQTINSGKAKKLRVDTSNGSIEINFLD